MTGSGAAGEVRFRLRLGLTVLGGTRWGTAGAMRFGSVGMVRLRRTWPVCDWD
jgi:hypothetical protein